MKNTVKSISKKVISCILALMIVFSCFSATLSVFADDAANLVTVTLDAATLGGKVDGEGTKTVSVEKGTPIKLSDSYTVVADDSKFSFVGWSTDSTDLVGEQTVTAKGGETYYAIFREVRYVDFTTESNGDGKTPEKPYWYMSDATKSDITSEVAVIVVSGKTSINSLGNSRGDWQARTNINSNIKHVYITSLDPKTGTDYRTERDACVEWFRSFQFNNASANPSLSDIMFSFNHVRFANTYAGGSVDSRLFARGSDVIIGDDVDFLPKDSVLYHAGDIILGSALDADVKTTLSHLGDASGFAFAMGSDGQTISGNVYAEINSYIGSELYMLRDTGTTLNGNATIVLNNAGFTKLHVMTNNAGTTITGNVSVCFDGIDKVAQNQNVNYFMAYNLMPNGSQIGGAINYIFNNGTYEDAYGANKLYTDGVGLNYQDNTDIIPTNGFYKIKSGVGGIVRPADNVEGSGKFEITTDADYIVINGNEWRRVEAKTAVYDLSALGDKTKTFDECDWIEITYVKYPESDKNVLTVPVNHKLDLSKIGVLFEGDTNPVNGDEVTWDSFNYPEAEIVNGTFIAFSEGEILVTASKDGETTGFMFKVTADAEATDGMVRFTQDGLTVERVGDGKYNVTVTETNDKALKYGTLTNNGAPIIKAVDNTGVTFTFTTANPEEMYITAEYITKAERETSIYFLGAQIRPETNEYTAGLRFINRFPQITGDGATATMAGGYTQAGIIVIPEILLDGATLPTADELVIPAGDPDGITEVSLGRSKAQNVRVKTLMSSTAVYSDATAVVVGIPDDMRHVKIVAIPYIIDESKNVTYVDEAQMDNVSKSYGEIYAAEFPISAATNYADANIKDVFAVIGTNHELDNDPNSNAITYELREEITYKVITAGNYGFEYELYKDNNGALAEYGEAAVAGVETCVKKGTYDPTTDGRIFTLTTRLDNPGTARLAIKVKDANGEYLNFNGVDNFSVTAAAGVDQIALPTYMVETEEKMDEFYSSISTKCATQVERMKAGLKSEEFTNWFMGTKTPGAVKTYSDNVSEVFEVTYVGRTGDYDQYSIVLATVASIAGFDGSPLTSADVDTGRFPYNDYLSRPSTFLISVPSSAAADSCEIVSGYYGYGTWSCHFQHQANTISLQTTAHGVLNLQNDAYYEKASEIDYKEGGTKDGPIVHSEESPYNLYGYGILVRDYMSLQFAKNMPQFNENADITTKGGSQGGWQALGVAAADKDVDICNTSITWLTIADVEDDGLDDGWMPSYSNAYKYIMSQNAVVSIGNRPGFRLDIEAALSDHICPLYGLLAMYNMSETETTFTGYQFSSHNYTNLFADAYGGEFTVHMNK